MQKIIIMRFIEGLSYETQSLLERIYKKSKKNEPRQKAHCILLSYRGFNINQLVNIFNVHLNTIYKWLNDWEAKGILSLYHKKGQGRKLLLENINEQDIKDLISENPKQLKKVVSLIEKKFAIKVSVRTLIRYLKKN